MLPWHRSDLNHDELGSGTDSGWGDWMRQNKNSREYIVLAGQLEGSGGPIILGHFSPPEAASCLTYCHKWYNQVDYRLRI